jgi:hypothetical protein
MTQEDYERTACAAVKSLPHTGNPEFDHLVDEIQREDTTTALYEMPARTAQQAA